MKSVSMITPLAERACEPARPWQFKHMSAADARRARSIAFAAARAAIG